ncbi:hypothetical protein Gotur_029939 [Gossypium turneri]
MRKKKSRNREVHEDDNQNQNRVSKKAREWWSPLKHDAAMENIDYMLSPKLPNYIASKITSFFHSDSIYLMPIDLLALPTNSWSLWMRI